MSISSSYLFLSGFLIKIVYAFIYPIYSTRFVHLTILDLITLTIKKFFFNTHLPECNKKCDRHVNCMGLMY
jgi:hypothetical protein